MTRKLGFLAIALLLATGALEAQAAYDSNTVKASMHVFFESLQAAKKASDGKDSKAATRAFQAIITAATPLTGMKAPQGSQADWEKAFQGLIGIAKKGAEASNAGDWTTVQNSVADIRKAMSAGHGEFR